MKIHFRLRFCITDQVLVRILIKLANRLELPEVSHLVSSQRQAI